ncbi:hypothetical protein I302_107012 [Kwoniella bestiolae CBS 10118]|uniref:Uncharacterized protein n=1 Tax=Kwoniella bestiolae CBS 10118 TaxID=1296100 RepID=A0A1B9FZS3_9TREE|nr:hypothetical protein I302_05724 [Kwoniella bestiolae CBS 10118]OCF24265.1 hypothetical protein I302_05724 [Kwoniella bestiolae CBS 10118]
MSQPPPNSSITFTVSIDVPPSSQVIKALSEKPLKSTRFEKTQTASHACNIDFEPISFKTTASMHLDWHTATDHGQIKRLERLDAQFALIPRKTIYLNTKVDSNHKITKATISAPSAKRVKSGKDQPIMEMNSPEWPAKIEHVYSSEEQLNSIEDIPHTYSYNSTATPESLNIPMGLGYVYLDLYDKRNKRRFQSVGEIVFSFGDITIGLEDEDEDEDDPRDGSQIKRTWKNKKKSFLAALNKGLGEVL